MRWSQIEFIALTITVGRAKTASGTGRTLPINDEPFAILQAHRQ